MSDLDTRPDEYACGAIATDGAERLVITARTVYLGKTTVVSRVLPDRELRMIGAWCFADHYGPEDVSATDGMRVWAHPHTGLQTVSWLFEGEIEHRDGLGSQAMVRPGELNVMTAGHGIVHSEISPSDKPPVMHGVQLWVALPDADRDIAPRFETHVDLPRIDRDGLTGTVLLGSVEGHVSPASTHTPLCGADLTLDAGTQTQLALDPGFEHGLLIVEGTAVIDGEEIGVDHLIYLGIRREAVNLSSSAGARIILLGGEPFKEEIVMWWNFIGRSHDEIGKFRDAWVAREERFSPVVSRDERVMEAPSMPTVALRPRPRRRSRP